MKSKTKRIHSKIKYQGLKPLQILELALGAVVIISIFLGLILIKKPVRQNISASEEAVDLYFVPSKMTIPSSTPTTLMMNARSNRIGFSKIQINFDPTKVKLAAEVSVSSPLKNIIKVTSMADANSSGKLIITLGLAVADKANPPTGNIVIGNLRFSPANTTANLSASVSIDATNSKVTSITPTTLPVNVFNLAILANPIASPAPTPISTAPTPVSTPVAVATQMTCTKLLSGSMSATTVAVSQKITITCDFGNATLDCIRPYYIDKTATAYVYPCTQTGWNGTKAVFSCTAPRTKGNYTNVCGLIAGTASNCKQELCSTNRTKFYVR